MMVDWLLLWEGKELMSVVCGKGYPGGQDTKHDPVTSSHAAQQRAYSQPVHRVTIISEHILSVVFYFNLLFQSS